MLLKHNVGLTVEPGQPGGAHTVMYHAQVTLEVLLYMLLNKGRALRYLYLVGFYENILHEVHKYLLST